MEGSKEEPSRARRHERRMTDARLKRGRQSGGPKLIDMMLCLLATAQCYSASAVNS
jgi:hypothetical protein